MFDDYTYICCCEECGIELPRYELSFSHDCHGIPFRLLCGECWDAAMAKGYDGEYYDERDECLDYDY